MMMYMYVLSTQHLMVIYTLLEYNINLELIYALMCSFLRREVLVWLSNEMVNFASRHSADDVLHAAELELNTLW